MTLLQGMDNAKKELWCTVTKRYRHTFMFNRSRGVDRGRGERYGRCRRRESKGRQKGGEMNISDKNLIL
jgi:hypothetical protein